MNDGMRRNECITAVGFWRALAPIFVTFALPVAVADAGLIFRDTFADGNAKDRMPVFWSGEFVSVVGGDLVLSTPQTGQIFSLTSTAGFLGDVLLDQLGDVSIRTEVRLETEGYIGVQARGSADFGNYLGYVKFDGEAGLFEGGVPGELLAYVQTDLNPLKMDLALQLDVIGTELALWVWPASEPMPREPLVTADDDTLQQGFMRLWIGGLREGDPLSGIFRYVHVSDMHIPEPSSLLLAVTAFFGSLGYSRRFTIPSAM